MKSNSFSIIKDSIKHLRQSQICFLIVPNRFLLLIPQNYFGIRCGWGCKVNAHSRLRNIEDLWLSLFHRGQTEVGKSEASRAAKPLSVLLSSAAAAAAAAPPRYANRWLVHIQHNPHLAVTQQRCRSVRYRGMLIYYTGTHGVDFITRDWHHVWGAKIHKEVKQARDGRGSQAERVGGCAELRGPCGEQSMNAVCGPAAVILANRENLTNWLAC